MRTAAVLLVTLTVLAGPSPSLAGDERAAPAAAKVVVAFKLDPRIAGPTYGGERWVSPRVFSGASAQDTVEVRATAVDASGRAMKVELDWTVSDPELATVAPPRGPQVRVTVKRAGESSVTVKAGGVSRKMTLAASQTKGVWQVSITP